MRPVYLFLLIILITEGIWSSLFYTRKKEVDKKFTFVDENLRKPFVATAIILSTVIPVSGLFVLLDIPVDSAQQLAILVTTAMASLVYIILSFTRSPTLLGNFLGF